MVLNHLKFDCSLEYISSLCGSDAQQRYVEGAWPIAVDAETVGVLQGGADGHIAMSASTVPIDPTRGQFYDPASWIPLILRY